MEVQARVPGLHPGIRLARCTHCVLQCVSSHWSTARSVGTAAQLLGKHLEDGKWIGDSVTESSPPELPSRRASWWSGHVDEKLVSWLLLEQHRANQRQVVGGGACLNIHQGDAWDACE